MSHDPSETILIYCFAAQETFFTISIENNHCKSSHCKAGFSPKYLLCTFKSKANKLTLEFNSRQKKKLYFFIYFFLLDFATALFLRLSQIAWYSTLKAWLQWYYSCSITVLITIKWLPQHTAFKTAFSSGVIITRMNTVWIITSLQSLQQVIITELLRCMD